MKKNVLLMVLVRYVAAVTALSLIHSLPTLSQITFQKTYGSGFAESVLQASDGGYIISGHTDAYGAGSGDMYVVKTDINGSVQWNRTYGTSLNEYCFCVQQTNDGGYILAGNNGTGLPNDYYVVKIDAIGDTIWTRTYGGPQGDIAKDIHQTTDGGYIVAGNISTSTDMYLVRTDGNGDTLWTKRYGQSSHYTHAEAIEQTADGGFIVVGDFTPQVSPLNKTDVYLLKISANGDIQWNKTYGGVGYDYGKDIKQTSDGGYIIVGNSSISESLPETDVYVIKTNSNGDTLWTRTFGETFNDEAFSVDITSDGGYSFAGWTDGSGMFSEKNFYLMKTDANGNIIFSKIYGTGGDFEVCRWGATTADGGYILAGKKSNLGKYYLVKTDGTGSSGCDDAISNTSVGTRNITISSASTQILPIVSVVGTPPTAVGSGGSAATICTGGTGVVRDALPPPLVVFPNPVKDVLTLNNMKYGKAHLKIVSTIGQTIREQDVDFFGTEIRLDVSELSAGVYTLNIHYGSVFEQAKLVKVDF